MEDNVQSVCFTLVSFTTDGATNVSMNGRLFNDEEGWVRFSESFQIPNAETFNGSAEWLKDTLIALVERY
uniref:Uncharacterized protein n=1 Tax=uncultured prokaryote TaxID=198431 RepID=A0A0H5Q6W5_9ZZZZ|nr:hypothetical protein [uncultured prokaryote]